ncbi:hypothetical protein G6F22_014033 [Rhizopus arrhizus]|nr:hypothetical protein G6F22_014033 [Rhizopus arrhizus]
MPAAQDLARSRPRGHAAPRVLPLPSAADRAVLRGLPARAATPGGCQAARRIGAAWHAYHLVLVAHRHHRASSRAPRALAVEPDLAVVLAVEQVVHVQLDVQLAIDPVARHQVHQRVRRLLDDVPRAAGQRLRGDLALRPQRAADAPFLVGARQVVHRGQLELVLRDVAGVGLARGAVHAAAGHLGARVGIADAHIQARQQLTVDVDLHALAFHLAHGTVAVGGDKAGRDIRDGLRQVRLRGREQRDGGVDALVQVTALQADLVVGALHRLDHGAGRVQVVLRLEDAGVAGVDRMVVVQVVDECGVRREVGVLAELAGAAPAALGDRPG